MSSAKKKRKAPKVTKHLWKVEVRHRDYKATMNSGDKTLYMKHSVLLIQSPQPPFERPDINLGLARAYRFLNRNQRQFGIPCIMRIEHDGDIDN